MNRFLHLLLGLLVALPAGAVVGVPPAPPKIEARAWMLLDVSSGQVLAGQNEDQTLEPASLTKLMTAYVVVDAMKRGKFDADDTLTVPDAATKAAGARMFARAGQAVKVDDLLMALIVQSANDAALTLAEGVAGSEHAFVGMMNAQAKKLGLANTQFGNAYGLSQPGHTRTARDLTRLANWLIASFPEQDRRYHAQREFSFNVHTLEEPLATCAEFRWTVRARFTLDGRQRATEWTGGYNTIGGYVDPMWIRRRPGKPALAAIPDDVTQFFAIVQTPDADGAPCKCQ